MRVTTAALIRDGSRFLFVKRPPGGDLGGCWELPGGKVDPGELPNEALARELREELGIRASVGESVAQARFVHRGVDFKLIAFDVDPGDEPVELLEHEQARFLSIDEALALELAPSDASLLRSLDSQGGPPPFDL